MPTFDDEGLEWFKSFLRIEAAFFEKLLEAGEASFQEVQQQWVLAQEENDEDHLEHLSGVGAEALDYIDSASELALVATYHWVERTLKRVLTQLLRSRAKNAGGVSHMNYADLGNAFAAEGVAVPGLTNQAEVNVLRLFANSWKHQVGDQAQPQLLQAIGLPPAPAPQGHLTVPTVRDAMAVRFGLQAGVQSGAIVRAAVPKAVAFLEALAGACP